MEWSKFPDSADMMSSEQTIPVFEFDRKFDVMLPSRSGWKDGCLQSLLEACQVIYTECSRFQGRTK